MHAAHRAYVTFASCGFPEVHCLGRYLNTEAQEGLAPHAHPGCIEICFLARGRQQYRVNDRDYVLRGGDNFVTFPHEMHDTGGAPQERGLLYWLIFEPPCAQRDFLGLSLDDRVALGTALLGLPHRHFPGSAEMGPLLDSVIATINDTRDDALRRIRVANHLVDFLLRVLASARHGRAPEITAPISRAMRHAERHTADNLRLGTLARVAGLSLPRFKARFRHEVGLPPADYVTRVRIEKAKRLLRAGSSTVTDTAHALGFASSQHFSTVFRRYTRQSPTRWRISRGHD